MRGIRWHLRIAAAILLMTGAGAYAASPGGSAASIAGIYAVARLNPKVSREVLANRYVDGLTLRYWWRNLEPSEGRFDWGKLDRDIALARSYGKKVSLTVGAGYGTPPWVYTASAHRSPSAGRCNGGRRCAASSGYQCRGIRYFCPSGARS